MSLLDPPDDGGPVGLTVGVVVETENHGMFPDPDPDPGVLYPWLDTWDFGSRTLDAGGDVVILGSKPAHAEQAYSVAS